MRACLHVKLYAISWMPVQQRQIIVSVCELIYVCVCVCLQQHWTQTVLDRLQGIKWCLCWGTFNSHTNHTYRNSKWLQALLSLSMSRLCPLNIAFIPMPATCRGMELHQTMCLGVYLCAHVRCNVWGLSMCLVVYHMVDIITPHGRQSISVGTTCQNGMLTHKHTRYIHSTHIGKP